jgi:lactate dehydrogenase-like 2-hydroxyacid dehydrogenase
MILGGLAQSLSGLVSNRFQFVGPWQAASEDAWWKEHSGAGIRVGISSGIDTWDEALFARLPDLEQIIVYGAGQSGIDLEAAKRRNISINASAVHAADVAEHAVAQILAGWRRVAEAHTWVQNGVWENKGRMLMTHRLFGRKVGVAGLGHIGREIALRMEGLGCEISWWGPRAKPDVRWPRVESLQQLAQDCDALAVAVFAHDGARKLISREIIEAVGPNGLLMNVSRGFVVDEDACIAALKDGRLGYAALDVFEEEPTPSARWKDVPNCLLSPHCAGMTFEAAVALRQRAVDAVLEVLARPPRGE